MPWTVASAAGARVPETLRRLARLRVPLGFVAGILVLWLASPTWSLLAAGTVAAVTGELIRIWAAGHLEKSREVTRSGPYRWSRHPLYVGSALMGVGVAIAGNSVLVAVIIGVYLAGTLTAAIRTEETFLREKFGPEYDEYCRGANRATERAFSFARAWRNREYRAVLGMGAVFAILALKALLLS
jgi:protein-S-isoprenylcysteine O-methyltransferase Ste14